MGQGTRWSLLKAPEHQSVYQLSTLAEVQTENRRLYRTFLLREELRLLYHLPDRPWRPSTWTPGWPGVSRLATETVPARTHPARAPRRHLAAIRLGLSNGRLEGLNSKIRLISHRAFGFHSADPLIALVYPCCADVTIELPR